MQGSQAESQPLLQTPIPFSILTTWLETQEAKGIGLVCVFKELAPSLAGESDE